AIDGTPINFLRASAVATVDAHNGAVKLYLTDENDPFRDLYQRACPTVFQPLSGMPTDLRRHLRYPAPLLSAQAEIWTRFHVKTPGELLRTEALWQLMPEDPIPDLFAPPQLPVRFNFSDLPQSTSQAASKYFERAFCTIALFTRSAQSRPATTPTGSTNTADIPSDTREIVGALFATRDAQSEQLATWQPARALALQSMSWLNESPVATRAANRAGNRNPPKTLESYSARRWSAPLFLSLSDGVVIGTQTRWPRGQFLATLGENPQIAAGAEIAAGTLPAGVVAGATNSTESQARTAQQKIAIFHGQRLQILQFDAAPNAAASGPDALKLPAHLVDSESSATPTPRLQPRRRPATTRATDKATGKRPPSTTPNAPRVLQQVRTLWRRMQNARQRGDWKTYGEAERALDKVLRP
ncbi:MAG: uncharacterized protein JWN98_1140, partial [Abditibacteriota bacterium]|nr:uncharacterized protein [Abditibacteriota bacterium]